MHHEGTNLSTGIRHTTTLVSNHGGIYIVKSQTMMKMVDMMIYVVLRASALPHSYPYALLLSDVQHKAC